MRQGDALPSGTVTFLFTDIERSTQTVEAMGNEAYAEALDTHRKLLRVAFEEHGGHEVGTEGDAFFVAFARAHDSVEAALLGQRALQDHPLRVRMGLHTGEALVRQGDYVGHDVHKAKRISDAGHGGQVLISQATAGLVRDAVDLLDLGPHRLKDLGEPERIYQVTADGLDRDFPPLRSLESFTHNLPAQRTSFVGRDKEIAEVSELLQRERILTLIGVGGCGKTRLAIQLGAELLDDYPDGVFFVDLSPLSEPDVIVRAIAGAVGLPLATDASLSVLGATDERLLAFLEGRKCLVILDNCEHVLDAAADITDAILERCPNVTILATSREPIDIEGEHAWRIPSLSVHEGSEAHRSEAVSLFKARAQAVRADFDLTPDNIDAVTAICQRLDGIPLAIEFAASRISHLSAQEIESRLGDMFQLLAGARRRRVQRQQTLQAALDWSYDLLSKVEQALLRRLAVFAGTFRLGAIEEICDGAPVDRHEILDVLGSLVTKSLVQIEETDGKTRYRLIETVRQYAAEKLREAGEAETYRARHRDWYVRWARSFDWLEPIWSYPDVYADHANFSLALERCADEGRLDLAFATAARLGVFWAARGYFEEGWRWLTTTDPGDLDILVEERVGGLMWAARLALFMQRSEAPGLLERAFELAGEEVSFPLVSTYLTRATMRAVASQWTRDAETAEAAREDSRIARQLAQEISSRAGAIAISNGGQVELILGDVAAAHACFEQLPADELYLHGGNGLLTATRHILGDRDSAAEAAHEELRMLDEDRDEHQRVFYADMIVFPAVALAGADEIARARALLEENIDGARRGRPGGLANLMIGFAALAYLAGDVPGASKLLAWVRSDTIDQGRIITHHSMYALYQHYVGLVRQALPPDEARRCRDEGRAMSADEAIAVARGLEVTEKPPAG